MVRAANPSSTKSTKPTKRRKGGESEDEDSHGEDGKDGPEEADDHDGVKGDDDDDDEGEGEGEGEEEHDGSDDDDGLTPADLIYIETKRNRSKGGRKSSAILDNLTRKAARRDNPDAEFWICVGGENKPCRKHWTHRNTKRAIRHALHCKFLPTSLRDTAVEYAHANSLGGLLEAFEPTEREMVAAGAAADVGDVTTDVGAAKRAVALKHENQWFKEGRSKGKELRKAELDLAVLKVLCVGLLPLNAVTHPEWTEMWEIADPKYTPATRSEIEDSQIPNQAVWVRHQQLKELRVLFDITLSFDGSTSNARESRWTLHASTHRGKVMLVATREATAEEHTAQFIIEFVMEVCTCCCSCWCIFLMLALQSADKIGVKRIGGIVSDNASACVSARKQLVERFLKAAIEIPDVCHLASNMIKDLARIDGFKPVCLSFPLTTISTNIDFSPDHRSSTYHHQVDACIPWMLCGPQACSRKPPNWTWIGSNRKNKVCNLGSCCSLRSEQHSCHQRCCTCA